MNSVNLIGRLTKDVIYNEDKKIASYTLAVRRTYKNSNGTYDAEFIPCVCFGRTAEYAKNNLAKGVKVGVTGSLITGRYTNNEGKTIYTVKVNVASHDPEKKKTVEVEDEFDESQFPMFDESEMPF